MKVLITTSSFDVGQNSALQALVRQGIEFTRNPFGRRLTEDEVAELLTSDVVGMVAGVEPLTRRVLERAKGLKVISRCGTGMESVDLAAATERGIAVLNTPDAPVDAVAELTVGLMLAVLRKIAQSDRAMRAGRWESPTGALLGARSVGIVGYGRIGRRVARLVGAFGARVLASDPAVARTEDGVGMVPLDELVAHADLVTLHVPYTAETHHLIDAARLSRMAAGSILINVSRGGLVDETAVVETLECGHLAGAAFDTFKTEPYSGPLTRFEQVVLTAHMGSRAGEARAAMELEAVANLASALATAGVLQGE